MLDAPGDRFDQTESHQRGADAFGFLEAAPVDDWPLVP